MNCRERGVSFRKWEKCRAAEYPAGEGDSRVAKEGFAVLLKGTPRSTAFCPVPGEETDMAEIVPLREYLKQRLLNGDFSCEKELTMSIVSGKWKIVILWHLGH